MVTDIFGVIADTITQFVNALVSGVNGLIPLIYTSGSNGGAGSFTFVGTMLLIAVGMGIVYWIFRLLRGLTAGLSR